MNKEKYRALLNRYQKWCDANPGQVRQDAQERKQYSEAMQALTPGALAAFTQEDFYNLLAPLWSMGMWGNKHIPIDSIIENNGMPLLRKELGNLLYSRDAIERRWKEFRDKIKGMGPAIMSEILGKFSPGEYILWNSKVQTGFNLLEVENVPKASCLIDGKKYAYLCARGRELVGYAQEQGVGEIDNLLALDYFIWQETQDVDSNVPVDSVPLPQTAQESIFIHDDVKEKIKQIGAWLGFRAGTEKKIADGAVVDAIWEVSVSNMGRITYVFEVQTKGSIDSLILNLLKSKNNSSVQGIVAVSDAVQIERIKKEAAAVKGLEDLKFWNYNEVLRVYEHLSSAFDSINALKLVPDGLF